MLMKDAMKAVVKFTEDRDWDQFHSPANLAKSISIEAGELLECFQWDDQYNMSNVCGELADVMTYCLLLSNKLGIDPEKIILEKLDVSNRKYPLEKSKGNSLKYTEL